MSADHVTDTTTGAADRAERLLDAGAVLPAGTLPGAGGPESTVDVLTARRYAHPVLDGPVVRLVPRALGPAEDAALDFLGLAPEGEAPEVGQVRQEALGFPAWALVHDPANGHHALAVVKEMERLARQVAAKPKTAKDGFEEIADRLGRAVPHFLPTYCEEVGRIFLAQGNQSYAGTFFGRAREAEQTFGLAVDEERLRAVFLEFALAGALTVKSLRQYVKELAGRLDPLTAWQRFRQLCAERSAAGMAPYAGVAEDARQLIRAAGLDRTEEELALLAELIASPAIGRAPAVFWKSWRPRLIELARREETVRARLLEILPTPSGSAQDNAAVDDAWLTVLRESGAEDLLTDPAARQAEPAAAWLRRWADHIDRGWRHRNGCGETVELAGRMAERLRAEDVPVTLFESLRSHVTKTNLLDRLLADGVPVADPPQGLRFDLVEWLSDPGAGRRDLAAVADDPRFRPALKAATPHLYETNRLAEQLKAFPRLRELFAEWAEEQADELCAARGLAGANTLLAGLGPVRSGILEANPKAAARIAALDVAALLGDTLRAGILDELGWPALDEAVARLELAEPKPGYAPGQRNDNTLEVHEAWPALILLRQDRAVVVGPEGILLEHDLRIPSASRRHWNRPRLRYADGELLVLFHGDDGLNGYWSNRPGEIFTPTGEQILWYYGTYPTSLPLPGGGRATGGRVLRAGDTAMPVHLPVLGDGTGYWVRAHGGARAQLLEYDPATGAHGRASVPPALAGGEGDLDLYHSRVLPLQPGLEGTPLGTDGTVLGVKVLRHGGRATAHGPDGRTATLPDTTGRRPLGRLDLPGGAALLLAHEDDKLALRPTDGTGARTDLLATLTPNGAGGPQAFGSGVVPPLDHWHALRPRDEAGSLRLRALTDHEAAGLIDAAWPVDAPETTPPASPEFVTVLGTRRQVAGVRAAGLPPLAAAATVLPADAHPLLVAGVAGLARLATDTATRAARFAPLPRERAPERPRPAAAPAHQPEHGTDLQVRTAVEGVLGDARMLGSRWRDRTSGAGTWKVLAGLRNAADLLAAPRPTDGGDWTLAPERVTLPGATDHHGWVHLLGRTAPLALAALSPRTADAERATLLLLLGELTGGFLADRGPELRRITLAEKVKDRADSKVHVGQVYRCGDRTVLILACEGSYTEETRWLALDHDPARRFTAVGDFALVDERRITDDLPAAWVAAFTERLKADGPVSHRPEQVEEFHAATGIGQARSALLLAAPRWVHDWSAELPPAEELAELGLQTATARAARPWLRGRPLDDVRAALLPADPAELWRTGLAVGAAAERYVQRHGRLATLGDEDQTKVVGTTIDAVEEVLNPQRAPWISRTTVQRLRPLDNGAHGLIPDDHEAVPQLRQLITAVGALRWLAHRIPYGDPLRPLLPAALAALRARLADPGLLIGLNHASTVRDTPLAAVLRSQAGLPEAGGAGEDGLVRCGDALVLAPLQQGEYAWLRPAGLTGADDPVLDLLEGLVVGYQVAEEFGALRALLGDDLARLVADGSEPGTAPGRPQDPLRTVPPLVGEVAAATGLSEDAAVLYLQLLALPDPTDRNAAAWTGWKPARLKKARAELAATDLVLEAKRARAGRTLFLPGGWQTARTPGLPVETWKAGLYELSEYRPILPHLPAPELFALAWRRVTDGDGPGYEQLRPATRPKGRR
ncbi:hypothetical protein [Kitasatospora camelliae]|uniref:DNA-binding protein n=1 Tax=Kitasatospora camelliae TaxID=3156397 RepID=A0AAU8K1T7_9ACTN